MTRGERHDSWDDDDFRFAMRRAPHSGMVTFVTVMALIIGITNLFCGAAGSLFAHIVRNADFLGASSVSFAIGYLVSGIVNIVGGIWSLNRHRGGRTLLLLAGAIHLGIGAGFAYWVVIATQGEAADQISGLPVIFGILAFKNLAYFALVYAVLLRPYYAEEFQS